MQPDWIPLEVLDFRVATYIIAEKYTKQVVPLVTTREAGISWIKAAWAIVLNRGYTGIPYAPFTLIVADDMPEYWRVPYLRERGIEYKAGRSSKTDDWFMVQAIGKEYIQHPNSPYFYCGYQGFEADDVAGAIARLAPKGRRVRLVSVDTDWSGCVNKDIHWCNMTQWTPRYRDEEGFMQWCMKKDYDYFVNKPEDLWKLKSKDGDSSDNLPPGSPIEVIDLLRPPAEYDLLNKPEAVERITEAVEANVNTSSRVHLDRALDYIKDRGMPVPLYNFSEFPLSS